MKDRTSLIHLAMLIDFYLAPQLSRLWVIEDINFRLPFSTFFRSFFTEYIHLKGLYFNIILFEHQHHKNWLFIVKVSEYLILGFKWGLVWTKLLGLSIFNGTMKLIFHQEGTISFLLRNSCFSLPQNFLKDSNIIL